MEESILNIVIIPLIIREMDHHGIHVEEIAGEEYELLELVHEVCR